MISVILPTLRPYQIQPTIESIRKASREKVEIVVVTRWGTQISGADYVVWEQPHGTVAAINAGYQASTGDSVFIMNDESTLDEGALDEMAYMLTCGDTIVQPRHDPPFNFTYFGREFAAFPLVTKAVLEEINTRPDIFLDPLYHCFYADPDLSLKAQMLHIPINTARAAVHHRQNHDSIKQANMDKYMERDRATFRARWDWLGSFVDPT